MIVLPPPIRRRHRARPSRVRPGVIVNDVHSQLNHTRLARCVDADTVDALRAALGQARRNGQAVSIAGGRHAMGGQQFGTDTVLLDLRGLRRVLALDAVRGQVEVEAGIQWPGLIAALLELQRGEPHQWGIIQKQTGADDLTLGGALAANVHGRGLRLQPIIGDVEAFTLMDAQGCLLRCSRQEHPGLFQLAIGGYGLFGIITSVRLRLTHRQKLQRVVRLLGVDELMEAFARRIADGSLYGDFQFTIDRHADDFLRRGIFSCYQPVEPNTPMSADQRGLSASQWQELVRLAHVAPGRAFDAYATHYLATDGQRYWSDLHQLSTYVPNYHGALNAEIVEGPPASEVITELYVPRRQLVRFLARVREDFRANEVPLIYGTVRLIEQDDESFLPWAREVYACVIFNVHTVHTARGIARAAEEFRRLIDRAIELGGSFYLTYHRFATREQVDACYPQFQEFLRLKRVYDPEARFQSDWYRHYKSLWERDEP